MKCCIVGLAALGFVACAARPPSPGGAGPQPSVAARPRSDSPGSSVSVAAQPSSERADSAVSVQPALVEVKFERVLSVPVTSIALGEGSRIAVLADVPYVGDARGLRP